MQRGAALFAVAVAALWATRPPPPEKPRTLFVYESVFTPREGINGVSRALRNVLRSWREKGREVVLYADESISTHPEADELWRTWNPFPSDGFGIPVLPYEAWMLWRVRPTSVVVCGEIVHNLWFPWLCHAFGIPYTLVHHSDLPRYFELKPLPGITAYYKTMHRWWSQLLAPRRIARSRYMARRLAEFGFGDDAATAIWYPGVDQTLFYSDPSVERKPQSLLFVGRVDADKRVDDLYQLVDALGPEYTLTLAGQIFESPPDRPNIRALGEVTSSDALRALYQNHSHFVFASDFDSFGTVVVEAMACGCTPVVRNASGPGEVVEHGVSGWVWNDIDEAAAILRRNVAVDGMGARAATFSIERSLATFEGLYADLNKHAQLGQQQGVGWTHL